MRRTEDRTFFMDIIRELPSGSMVKDPVTGKLVEVSVFIRDIAPNRSLESLRTVCKDLLTERGGNDVKAF